MPITPPKQVYRTATQRIPYEAHGTQITNISDPVVDILWNILCYYNGETMGRQWATMTRTETWQLTETRPPSIQDLLQCSDGLWDDRYASVFEQLQAGGFLDSTYLLQKRIEWDPKPVALAFMGQLFGGVYSEVRSTVRPDAAPIYGDPNESLTHRLGVELWYDLAQLHGWDAVRYPGSENSARPDLRVTNDVDGSTSVAHVEVLTDHNNLDMLDRKRELMQQLDGACFWVFENRQHATRVLNYWCESSPLELVNAPYSNAGNHAFSKLNEYIARSSEHSAYTCESITEITSIPKLFDVVHNHVT